VELVAKFRVLPDSYTLLIGTSEKNGPYNMHRQVFDWITTKYPNPNHKFTNGAVPATGEHRLLVLSSLKRADSVDYTDLHD
jgi:hypothetical protein